MLGTARNAHKSEGYIQGVPLQKHVLIEVNMTIRLQWAQGHIN
jgi:hypothetical protein